MIYRKPASKTIYNIRILRVPEGAKKQTGPENLFKEIMRENYPNFRKKMNIQIHFVQRTSISLNINKSSLKHII